MLQKHARVKWLQKRSISPFLLKGRKKIAILRALNKNEEQMEVERQLFHAITVYRADLAELSQSLAMCCHDGRCTREQWIPLCDSGEEVCWEKSMQF